MIHFLTVLGSIKINKSSLSNVAVVLLCVTWYFFFIFCYPLKIFMAFTTIVTSFMFFFYRRISISFESVLTLFFLLQKDFDTFYKRLFKAFLCFLIMSREHFLHLWKNYLIGFYRSINRFEYKPLKIAWNHFNHLNQQSFQSALHTLCEKCSNTEFFFVHIFLYLDWIQENMGHN